MEIEMIVQRRKEFLVRPLLDFHDRIAIDVSARKSGGRTCMWNHTEQTEISKYYTQNSTEEFGHRLYVKFETKNPQGLYQEITSRGYSIVDSKIKFEDTERN